MTPTNNSPSLPAQFSLTKKMLVGAGIGLLLISVFVIPAIRDPNPQWGKFWMIRPLIIVPLAGATGGAFNYFIIHFRSLVGLNKTVARIVSAIVFLFGLWVGSILGLDGTMWD